MSCVDEASPDQAAREMSTTVIPLLFHFLILLLGCALEWTALNSSC
jgi:hypothetical protein